MNIYMKIGKRNEKRKKKRNSELTGLGDFGPVSAGAGRRPTEEQSSMGRHRGCGPMRQREEGGNGVERARGGGRTGLARPPVRSAAVLCREPGFATEEGWRGTGGVGDHGGGANLARGCSGWPAHGEVAGARGGEVTGEAAERDRGRGWVHCVCEGMAKL
jgi:hypothetical protein